MRTIIGIDNGVTGGITVIATSVMLHEKTPVKKELSYTKKKQYVTRIEHTKLVRLLDSIVCNAPCEDPICLIERPMVNPGRFKATISAIRALESTVIALERLKIAIQYIDSKEWQKEMLPKGLKGPELKTAANDVAKRLFPRIPKIVNADSLLIAEWGRRKYQ